MFKALKYGLFNLFSKLNKVDLGFFFLQRLEETRYDLMWAEKENYLKLIIHPGMLSDHMPDRVMKAMDRIFLQDHGVQEV